MPVYEMVCGSMDGGSIDNVGFLVMDGWMHGWMMEERWF